MGKAKDLATALYSVCTNTSVCSSCDCYEICHKYGIKPYDKYIYADDFSIKELTQKIKERDKRGK